MYYSNKWLLFCTHKQLAGGKGDGMVCESLLQPVWNNDGYDATGDGVGTNSGMDYWNGTLDWSTGLSYSPFVDKFLCYF